MTIGLMLRMSEWKEPRLYGAGLSVTLPLPPLGVQSLLYLASAESPSSPHRPDKQGNQKVTGKFSLWIGSKLGRISV